MASKAALHSKLGHSKQELLRSLQSFAVLQCSGQYCGIFPLTSISHFVFQNVVLFFVFKEK